LAAVSAAISSSRRTIASFHPAATSFWPSISFSKAAIWARIFVDIGVAPPPLDQKLVDLPLDLPDLQPDGLPVFLLACTASFFLQNLGRTISLASAIFFLAAPDLVQRKGSLVDGGLSPPRPRPSRPDGLFDLGLPPAPLLLFPKAGKKYAPRCGYGLPLGRKPASLSRPDNLWPYVITACSPPSGPQAGPFPLCFSRPGFFWAFRVSSHFHKLGLQPLDLVGPA
jgi:hypothetical protein